jgi:hypothetical protein
MFDSQQISIQKNCLFFFFFKFCLLFSVDIMSKKLDPEGLGIILLNAFMDEFLPEEKRSVADTFDLLHYNGIPRSNADDKVRLEK